ncbi:transglycosylase SLT domain-containing protein [Afipia carboxidovorans]|uniref:transglycosylase SLT domain-containing protein n=1 Tax=Afipia carboxidovorans TaxID=40137 RepID=UPI0030904258|nr:hypothetical protein CRBSH125_09460 [Afipia carboxidovorans]
MAALSFAFDPSKGETPETVASRRKTADALAARIFGRAPQNVGEGLNALGQAWIAASMRDEANDAQKAGQASAADAWKQFLMGGGDAPGTISTMPSVPASSPVIPSAPTTAPAASGVPFAGASGGSPQSYFDAVKTAESGGNPNARSTTSSATGLYQFTTPTWNDLMRNRPDLGLTSDGRLDPQQQERAMRAFTDQNSGILTGAGIDASPANLYAAHFLGAGGAKSVLGKPDGTPMVIAAGPEVVKANPFLANMTVGDFKNWAGRKVGDATYSPQQPFPAPLPNQQPQIVDANQPSPLDTAHYPFGPAGMPTEDAELPVNAQPTQGRLPTAPQPKKGGYSLEQLAQLSANPWLNDGQRAVVNVMLKQKMQEQDPMRGLQMEKLRADIAKTQRETAEGQSGVFGTPIYGKDPKTGKTVLGAITKNGNFKPLDTGDVEVTPGVTWQDFGTYRQGFDKSGQPVTPAVPKENQAEASAKALGAAEGKSRGEAAASYRSMSSKLPGLEKVVGELDKLADEATYTYAGRALDEGRRQLGMEPRDSAVARTKYIAMVDNQILPLLRDTFGAQFTVQEGESLRATLGDPNKTPAEKKEVLRAFINQKRRDIEALALQSMDGASDKRSAPTGPVTINGYKIEAIN